MLKVKTYIKESSIPNAGMGLFAKEFIPAGTIIWQYDPNIDREYKENEFSSLTGTNKEFVTTYSFRFDDKYYLCVDNARFFNHSDQPNCHSTDFRAECLGFTRALRDIATGEELTDDYSKFGLTEGDREFNMSF